jgi:hypothetical protein
MNETELLLAVFFVCLGIVASFLGLKFWQVMGQMASLQSALDRSMKAKADLQKALENSAKREEELQRALNNCLSTHGGK